MHLLPSEWLAYLVPTNFYPDRSLAGMQSCGIVYRDGLLTSGIPGGNPYSTYGRHSRVPVYTEREIVKRAHELGIELTFEQHSEDRLAFGFEIVTAVWALVCPITRELPPSTYEPDAIVKARLDLAAIRGYGY